MRRYCIFPFQKRYIVDLLEIEGLVREVKTEYEYDPRKVIPAFI